MSDDEQMAKTRAMVEDYDLRVKRGEPAPDGVLIEMLRDLLARFDFARLRSECRRKLLEGIETSAVRALPADERLILMRQNPGGNYYWTKAVAEVSLGELRAMLGDAE